MARDDKTYLVTWPDGMQKLLKFRWSVSRGRDTAGYNICSLWVDGDKVASCNGGGYDMQGTVLAEWFRGVAEEQLRGLDAEEFYGLGFWNPKTQERARTWSQGCKVTLDGACGFSSVERVMGACGFRITHMR